MTVDEAITTDVGSKTFRLVRKGYDPHEVRRYLSKLADEISALRTKADAPPVDAASSAPGPAAETTEVAALVDPTPGDDASGEPPVDIVEESATVAPGLDSPVEPPEPDPAVAVPIDADATSPEAASPEAASPEIASPSTASPDTPAAAPDASPGEGDRWAQMGRHVASVLAAADREAVAIKGSAEQHAARRLAALDGEIEEKQAALREVRRQLTEVHTLVGRSLSDLPADAPVPDPGAATGVSGP